MSWDDRHPCLPRLWKWCRCCNSPLIGEIWGYFGRPVLREDHWRLKTFHCSLAHAVYKPKAWFFASHAYEYRLFLAHIPQLWGFAGTLVLSWWAAIFAFDFSNTKSFSMHSPLKASKIQKLGFEPAFYVYVEGNSRILSLFNPECQHRCVGTLNGDVWPLKAVLSLWTKSGNFFELEKWLTCGRFG